MKWLIHYGLPVLWRNGVNIYTARPGHNELIFHIRTCVISPLSDRRKVEIQTTCWLLRWLLTPTTCFQFLTKRPNGSTLLFLAEHKPPDSPLLQFLKSKSLSHGILQFILASDTSSQSYPYLLWGMKKCVKVFDSTFSIYHTFCFITFFTSPTICFLPKHNRLFSGGNINCFNCLEFHTLCRCERHQWLFL